MIFQRIFRFARSLLDIRNAGICRYRIMREDDRVSLPYRSLLVAFVGT